MEVPDLLFWLLIHRPLEGGPTPVSQFSRLCAKSCTHAATGLLKGNRSWTAQV